MLTLLIILAAIYLVDRTVVRVIRQRVASRKHVADLQWRMSAYSYKARSNA